METKIGVLALQGAVDEHLNMIHEVGAVGIAIKRKEQLTGIDGIIIPGCESTTIGKMMRKYGFIEEIRSLAMSGKPIFGTCAGTLPTAERALEWELPWLPDSIVNMIDGLIEQLLPQGSFIVPVYFQQFDPPYRMK